MRLPHGARRAAIWGVIAGGLAAAAVAGASVLGAVDLGLAVPTGVIAAVSAAGTRLQIAATRRAVETIEKRVSALSAGVSEAIAAAEFSAMDVPYPLPVGGPWALKWDASSVLAREVAAARPQVVVELGSGGSSLVIGLVLQHLGRGHLYTLDHDPEFAARTRAHVRSLGLEDRVSVLDSPLVEVEVNGERHRWYDLPAEVRGLPRLDFLVVDGPPQRLEPGGQPRYPALPLFRDRLGPGSVVYVDDALRPTDAQMLERWLAEQPIWTRQTFKTRAGTAILRWPGSAG